MKIFCTAVMCVAALFLTAGMVLAADANFHIGIATGTVSQSEDSLRGAERMIQEYGDSSNGGIITHITYPDNFMSEMETTIGQLAGLADDPLMKAVIVNQSVPGTTDGLRRIRDKRPDIILIAAQPQEDPAVVTSVADIAVSINNIARGYMLPLGAKQLGVNTYVHISFPRHMSVELLGRRAAIMQQACEDMGIKFVFETAPDPTSEVGVAGAQQFILENVPVWLDKYGKNTAFFCTNDAHVEPLVKRVAELGGYFPEASLPSPLMGYPGALGIDLSKEKGNFQAILKKVEEEVINSGGSGRLGTWAYSFDYTQSTALIEYAKRIIEGTAKLDSFKDMIDCYNKFTPGAKWNVSNYTDAGTGVRNAKFRLVCQDTYIFGLGYMGIADAEIPEKYFYISRQK